VPRASTIASILVAWLLVTTALAQERTPTRVALVIGNGAYPGAPLRNAVNDARSMSDSLARLGFRVITAENAGRDTMQKSILDFAAMLKDDSTGLFYYAGHGVQSRGKNYLLPVDAEVASERALKFEAVNVQAVLEEMAFAGNRVNIVILDACRNNPFERRFRGGSRGLAAIDAARGTLIAYATSPGSVAADGDGDNGLYTAELLAALAVPDLKAEEVFKRVRVAVSDRSGGAQVPWESSSLTGDFVFNRRGEQVRVAAAAPTAAIGSDHEALFWETIKNSDNPDDFRAYLHQYPEGTFAGLARIRVSALESSARGEKPLGAGDGPLKVALLPFDGWHIGGKLPMALNNMERGVSHVIKNVPRLELVYVYDQDGGNDPRVGTAKRYWEGPARDKSPNREEMLTAGRQLGADVVFTYFFERDESQIKVTGYALDVHTGKMLKRDITGKEKRGQAKILTQEMVRELIIGG
jgi:hypothetical protein